MASRFSGPCKSALAEGLPEFFFLLPESDRFFIDRFSIKKNIKQVQLEWSNVAISQTAW